MRPARRRFPASRSTRSPTRSAASRPVPLHVVPALDDVPAAVASLARAGRSGDHARRRFDRRRRRTDSRGARARADAHAGAPHERRRRRAEQNVPPGDAQAGAPARTGARDLAGASARVGGLRDPGRCTPVPRGRPWSRARRAAPGRGGSPCAATRGCRRARCRRSSTASAATNILAVDLDAYRRRLLDSPWVADARAAPRAAVDHRVSGHRAAADGASPAGRQLYWSTDAARSSTSTARSTRNSTCRSSTASSRAPASRRAGVDEPACGSRRACSTRSRPPGLGGAVSQIDVRDAHDAVVLLDGDPALLHLGDDAVRRAAADVLELAPTLRERVPDIDYVDLRFDERVMCVPMHATGPSDSGRGQRRAHGQRRARAASATDSVIGGHVARKERYLVGLDVGHVEGLGHRRRGDGRRRPGHHRHRRSPSRRASAAASSSTSRRPSSRSSGRSTRPS